MRIFRKLIPMFYFIRDLFTVFCIHKAIKIAKYKTYFPEVPRKLF